MDKSSTSRGPSRREALKFAGAAALGGAVVTSLGASPVGAVTSHALGASAIPNNKFSVVIGGVTQAHVTSFSDNGAPADPLTENDPTTGALLTSRPGKNSAGKIVITKDWSNTSEWYKWRKAVLDGKVERKSISIIYHDDAGGESGRANYTNAFPISWSPPQVFATAKSSGHAQETIELSYETMVMQ